MCRTRKPRRRRTMSFITYKQADSRWGKKNYNGSSTMAAAGCGPTSVAMLAYAVDGKTTPIDTMKYMQQHHYAIYGNGTAWGGIPACMKAFGLKDVRNVEKMEDVWKYMAKGYCGVFLFKAGSKGGICWTTSGHYIAVTDYKVKNGKHYLYTRDSGGRNHTGWYCYETQMRGLIPQIWLGRVPTADEKAKPKKTYLKLIDVSDHQGRITWKKVTPNYVIIRAGYGAGNTDKRFIRNIEKAIKRGKKIGIYWFSYAYSKDMAKKEAQYCLKLLEPYKEHITLGVYFDFEYDSRRYALNHVKTCGKSLITAMTKAFMVEVKKGGYMAGFYYNYDYKKNYYDMDQLKDYLHWYALYSDEIPECDIQQTGSNGTVPGIPGKVDMNRIINMPKAA